MKANAVTTPEMRLGAARCVGLETKLSSFKLISIAFPHAGLRRLRFTCYNRPETQVEAEHTAQDSVD